MNHWAPLWSMIVDSSLWDESDLVVKVFMTMLALKDSDHIVRRNAYQLAKDARKTEIEVLEALKILAAPDTKRVEKQQFDGRRIQAVEEGWLILNGEKYRALLSKEMQRARNRRAQANYRARINSQPLKGELEYVKASNNGAGRAALDRITTKHLPDESVKG